MLQQKRQRRKVKKTGGETLHSMLVLSLVAVLAIVLAVGSKMIGNGQNNQVYAASESEEEASGAEQKTLPTGIAGFISGVVESHVPGSKVNRIGTSCEQVVVGQRVQKVESGAAELNVSESMESTVNDWDSKAVSLAATPKIMSDTDYETLLLIVEAEAGTEDLKGRILVGNVIMNRVKHEEFPDTVTEVVWEYENGVPQFSPTYDGRISTVTVSDETREAVKQVLEGVDYSEGALFFVQKSAAESDNVSWFDQDLKWLFKHGVHEFYTYPDEKEETTEKDTEKTSNTVQMAMAE